MHIAFLNPQGNFDPNDSYLTEHPDFGGQLVYVKETALAMAEQGHTVDIVTRRIRDDAWPEFADDQGTYPGFEGRVRILRLLRPLRRLPCSNTRVLPRWIWKVTVLPWRHRKPGCRFWWLGRSPIRHRGLFLPRRSPVSGPMEAVGPLPYSRNCWPAQRHFRR